MRKRPAHLDLGDLSFAEIEITHVVPKGRPRHRTAKPCWCQPEAHEDEAGNIVVTHFAPN